MSEITPSVQCRKCEAIILHSPHHLTGCFCDPDGPTWICITAAGEIRGGSHSNYERLT
jgi:hypothetical protein